MIIGIVAIGNPLKSDDGVGQAILSELREENLPSNVKLFDVGTSGINLLHILKELDIAIIIDAVKFGGKPGDHIFFSTDDINSLRQSKSSHDSHMFDIVKLSKKLGESPEKIVFLGIEPKEIELGGCLSKDVENKIPLIIERLREKLKKPDFF